MKEEKIHHIHFAFFGSSRMSVLVLNQLERFGFIPACIVTTPDKPRGRSLNIKANEVKQWGLDRDIKVYDPALFTDEVIAQLKSEGCEIFIVASYGKIIPEKIYDMPEHKTLNIHPSLLPLYRGATPMQSAILNDDKDIGVTIMRVTKGMDEGPIVAQNKVDFKQFPKEEWPTYEDFEEVMAYEGAKLLADILRGWISDELKEKEQDHSQATYTRKIKKEDARINLADDAYVNFRKIQAYQGSPVAFFIHSYKGKDMRVKIIKASYEKDASGTGKLIIEKVIPESGKEMDFDSFVRGHGNPL